MAIFLNLLKLVNGNYSEVSLRALKVFFINHDCLRNDRCINNNRFNLKALKVQV